VPAITRRRWTRSARASRISCFPSRGRRSNTTSAARTSSLGTGRRKGTRCASAARLQDRCRPAFTENLNLPTVRLLDAFLRAAAPSSPAARRRSGSTASSRIRARPSRRSRAGNRCRPEKCLPCSARVRTPDSRSRAPRGSRHSVPPPAATGRRRTPAAREHERGGALVRTVESRRAASNSGIPQTGHIRPYPFEPAAGGSLLRFDLPEAGSLLLLLSKATENPVAPQRNGSSR